MKSLTHYEKIWLICVAVLFCVLCFYLGKAVYAWTNQSIVGQEIPKGEYENAPVVKRVIPYQGQAFTPVEVHTFPDACNCPGNVKLLATTFNGETIYRLDECKWIWSTPTVLGSDREISYGWREVVKPTHDKAKAMKEYTKRKKEYDIMKAEAEISKLKWKVVK